MSVRLIPPAHRAAIREIFLRRRSEYTTRDAARLLRLTLGEFLAWIEDDALHVERRRKRKQLGGHRHELVKWAELVSAAMVRWTVMEIHDALGKEAHGTLPRLLRPVELKSVRLPEYQIRLLETLSQHAGVTIEEYIYTALLSLETAASPEAIERLLPGFREAIRFPNEE
jgi:hypothetical protein